MAVPSHLTEDDIYRASTQYRLWSFTPDSLATLRIETNSLAAARVKDAIRRAKGADGGPDPAANVDCLTVEEEQKLVGFYCLQTMDFADVCEFPTNIKATAVQYLKRFYLSNSPMAYHPKQMMPSALFLSTKTDNHYMSLKTFASKLPKSTEESVIAPEFLLTQGLRFTFDVRHPHRGLEGGFMELQAMASGTYVGPGSGADKSKQLREEMLDIEPAAGAKTTERNTAGLQKRIQTAHYKASHLLKTSAILSDAYFLYTPAQIWLAAFTASDGPLAMFYIKTILNPALNIEDQLLETVSSCAEFLVSKTSSKPDEKELVELRRIDKKLYKCRNPEKLDITGLNQAQKREGAGTEGIEDEKVVKKRKLEKEKTQADVFGPAIPD